MEEVQALLILLHQASGKKVRVLLEHFGSAVEVLPHIKKEEGWQRDWELVQEQGIQLLSYKDEAYPAALRQLPDYPLLLYVKGKILPEDARSISIVGTRGCTLYGSEMAGRCAQEVAECGYTVVSGLARGIDTAAHKGALKSGRTIAFLGSGLGVIYPSENRDLSEEIAQRGALVSEFPMTSSPDRYKFPMRNRLIAGFSLATLLVEAPVKSGAMITQSLAWSLGRKCFTLPGRADVESFQGNHSLIKTQKALLVENGREMVSILEPGSVKLSLKRSVAPEVGRYSEEEQQLLSLFATSEIALEELALKAPFPLPKLSALLMGLVLKGGIRELPGKHYKLELH